jgi:hypothetical protein
VTPQNNAVSSLVKASKPQCKLIPISFFRRIFGYSRLTDLLKLSQNHVENSTSSYICLFFLYVRRNEKKSSLEWKCFFNQIFYLQIFFHSPENGEKSFQNEIQFLRFFFSMVCKARATEQISRKLI